MLKYKIKTTYAHKRSVILTALEEQVLILLTRTTKPLYSCDIVKLLRQLSNNQITLSSGTVTPMIKRLLKEGLIEAHDTALLHRSCNVRKAYRATNAAAAVLSNAEQLRQRIHRFTHDESDAKV